ncbi:MAG: HAD-IIA family hydrolase [Bacteroidota bacterium]
MNLVPFQSIFSKYKAIFLDSYGVLVNHRGLIEGVPAVIQQIRNANIPLKILTNSAARNAEKQAERYQRRGLTSIRANEIITSGMMAKIFLSNKIKEGAVAYLGTPQAASYIFEANLTAIPVGQVNEKNIKEVQAMVFLDDEGYDWNVDINATVNLLRQRNIPAIVANSDKLYPVSKNEVSIATGGIAQLVESILGRAFIQFGKPDSQMFMHAFGQLPKELKIERNEILMVGDTLHTDILGGNKFGIDTLLVLSGNTSEKEFITKIRATGVIPNYVSSSIVT